MFHSLSYTGDTLGISMYSEILGTTSSSQACCEKETAHKKGWNLGDKRSGGFDIHSGVTDQANGWVCTRPWAARVQDRHGDLRKHRARELSKSSIIKKHILLLILYYPASKFQIMHAEFAIYLFFCIRSNSAINLSNFFSLFASFRRRRLSGEGSDRSSLSLPLFRDEFPESRRSPDSLRSRPFSRPRVSPVLSLPPLP